MAKTSSWASHNVVLQRTINLSTRWSPYIWGEYPFVLPFNAEDAAYTAPTSTPALAGPHDLGLEEKYPVSVADLHNSLTDPTHPLIIYSDTESPGPNEDCCRQT
uniref:Uncharacterized protein n=1 Tax=Nodulisporium sp. TaxID=1897413 RepID=A0A2R4QF03_9PEZI|nr:hypothetical protein [Nodulisporium sp.]